MADGGCVAPLYPDGETNSFYGKPAYRIPNSIKSQKNVDFTVSRPRQLDALGMPNKKIQRRRGRSNGTSLTKRPRIQVDSSRVLLLQHRRRRPPGCESQRDDDDVVVVVVVVRSQAIIKEAAKPVGVWAKYCRTAFRFGKTPLTSFCTRP